MTIPVPRDVLWIVSTLEDAGYETWTVGGAVRDALMERPSGDWDLTTRATPEEVRRVFRRTVPVGIEHGTVGVLSEAGIMYEVTTFRRDVETFGRHAVVAFAETLLEDLERRDFTINAMAWHPLRGELCDPEGGADDLAEGVLRTVGLPEARFAEDYLRILRALRFAGRFGLMVEPQTWAAARAGAPKLVELSPERVREELWKVLSADPAPHRALELYRRSGAFEVLYPEIARFTGGKRDHVSLHWRETLSTVNAVPMDRPDLRLAALLGHVGEPPFHEDDPPLPTDPGPASGPERLRAMGRAAALLTRLRHSKAQVSDIAGWVGAGPGLPAADAPGAQMRRWLSRTGRDRVEPIVRWTRAQAQAGLQGVLDEAAVNRSSLALQDILESGVPLAVGELAITGRDLIAIGLKPGPWFGEILNTLLERVLDEPAMNEPEQLLEWAGELAEEMR